MTATDSAYPTAESTIATRHRDRVGYDRAAVHAALDATPFCHLGYVVDGRPVVIPTLFVRRSETLYVHSSSGAHAAGEAADGGIAVCVTVTHVDGLVLARAAFHHSINYRSVVVHGTAEPVTDEQEKRAVLSDVVDHVVPGRSEHVRGPSRRELAATAVLRLPLREVSLKVRTGPPADDDEDLALPYWAGVVPLITSAGEPAPAPELDPSAAVPDHVRKVATFPRS